MGGAEVGVVVAQAVGVDPLVDARPSSNALAVNRPGAAHTPPPWCENETRGPAVSPPLHARHRPLGGLESAFLSR